MMAFVKTLSTLCFETIVFEPRCVAACSTLNATFRNIVFSWLAAHDFLVDPDYSNALELFLQAPLDWADLDCAGSVTSDFLKWMAGRCTRLKWLKLSCSFRALDEGVMKLMIEMSHLEHLQIEELKIDDTALCQLKSDKLHTVMLQLYIRDQNWHELENVVENNPSISTLSCSTRGRTLPKEDRLIYKICNNLSNTLVNLELNNIAVEKESLSHLLLTCTNITQLKLSGVIQFELQTMIQASQICHWKVFDVAFKVTPPMETYEALQFLPVTVSELGYRFGPCNRNMICSSICSLPNLCKLRFHAEFFNDSLTEKLISQIGQKLLSLDIGLCESLTDEGLGSIADYCTSLQSLVIHSDGNKYNRTATAMPLLRLIQKPQISANLRTLYLNYFKGLSCDFLLIIAVECINLEELHLAGVRAVRDNMLYLLAQNCPKLHLLDINGCWNVSDQGVCAVAQHLPLTHLNIAMCYRLTNVSIRALTLYCTSLEKLLYNGIPAITKEAIADLNKNCWKRLRSYFYQWLKSKTTTNKRFLNRLIMDSLPKERKTKFKRQHDDGCSSTHQLNRQKDTKKRKTDVKRS